MTQHRYGCDLPCVYEAAAGEMGEGAPEGTYRIAQHPHYADIEIVTLPNGHGVYRVKGYPIAAYVFEGDGEGVIRPDGSRFYRVEGEGGITVADGATLRDAISEAERIA